MKNPSLAIILTTALGLWFGTTAQGSVIVTYAEQPNDENSTLSGTQVYNFDSLSTGLNTNVDWNGVGTFNQLYVKTADQYGGATSAQSPAGSKYSVQGEGTVVSSTTLTLNQETGYFGMWWSAGDAANVLDFYNNGTLVAQFTTANLLQALGSSYDGNPRNRSLDSGEPFAFINFFGDATTTWNEVVLTNNASSGFESDNYTSRISTWNPTTDGALPGVTVARVSGTTVTKLSGGTQGAALWGSADAVPGAPVPPLPVLLAFGALAVVKCRKKRPATEV